VLRPPGPDHGAGGNRRLNCSPMDPAPDTTAGTPPAAAGVVPGAAQTVLYYDGVCGLCDQLVQFVMNHDTSRTIHYSALQGAHAEKILVPRGFDPKALDTVHVLTASGKVLVKSRAIFHIFGILPWPWKALAWLRLIPRPLTDLGYKWVAAIRYRIWGRKDACPLPPPHARALFLD